jgi:hypothetical protein
MPAPEPRARELSPGTGPSSRSPESSSTAELADPATAELTGPAVPTREPSSVTAEPATAELTGPAVPAREPSVTTEPATAELTDPAVPARELSAAIAELAELVTAELTGAAAREPSPASAEPATAEPARLSLGPAEAHLSLRTSSRRLSPLAPPTSLLPPRGLP